jgi:predicted DNA-binding transcriptional regulator AlpA
MGCAAVALQSATTKAKANASGKSGEDEEDHHQGNAVDSADLVPPDDLIMLAEVAKLLGVAPSTAARYSNLGSFPAPVERLATGRVWPRVDVERWGRETLPLPRGRPRGAS